MMNNKSYLAKILPHNEPMILIDDVVDYSLEEQWLKSCVTIRENSLFYDKQLNGIDGSVGIEYMAQTIGCYFFLRNKPDEPQIGFLLGTRLYNNAVDKFELGKTYYVFVRETFTSELSSFECLIYNDKNEEISSATINVYQNENDNFKEKMNG